MPITINTPEKAKPDRTAISSYLYNPIRSSVITPHDHTPRLRICIWSK